VPIPPELVPKDAGVEIAAKVRRRRKRREGGRRDGGRKGCSRSTWPFLLVSQML